MSTYTIHAKTVGGIKKASMHASEVKAQKAIVGVHSPNAIRLLRFDTAFETRAKDELMW